MMLTSIARSLIRRVKRPGRDQPRIIMTLLCRDEEDVIGYNVAYHLAQGIDFIIATDNASRDRTPRLLERFAREGRLHLIHEPALTHDQGTWVTRMARMAATRFDADWVINNDADEFWTSRAGTLRAALAAVPRDTECLAVPRSDMLPPRDATSRFFETMVVRRSANRSVHHGGVVGTKVCHRAYPDIRVKEGNHHVKRRGSRVPERSDHSLEILHFPLRSAEQLERKIRQGAEALSANTRVGPGAGRHWRRLYRDYLPTGGLDAYYMERAPTDEEIAAGVASGEFIRDTRVRDALRCLEPALVDPALLEAT